MIPQFGSSGSDEQFSQSAIELIEIIDEDIRFLENLARGLDDDYPPIALKTIEQQLENLASKYNRFYGFRGRAYRKVLNSSNSMKQDAKTLIARLRELVSLFEDYRRERNRFSRAEVYFKIDDALLDLQNLRVGCQYLT